MVRVLNDNFGLKGRIDELLEKFVGVYSSSGTKNEKLVEKFYGEWFDSMEYFKTRGEQAGFFRIPGDVFERAISWCVLRGSGDDAVVLLHHYDVVDTDDYRNLRDIATKPGELMAALKSGKMGLDEESAKDLASGKWIFGRGTADMKGGAAIQMALFERYAIRAGEGNLRGNIVLLGLPDEENLSSGGRAAPLILKELKDRYGLNYLLALNSEPTDRGLGEDSPKIQVSSIGKVMPLIYARGVLSHAGKVYDGLNPIKLMSEVVGRLDLNPEFIDEFEGVVSPASTFLYLKDAKNVYDVSLPMAASGYMSVMFMKKSIGEIMDIIRRSCVCAFDSVIADVQSSFDAYTRTGGGVSRKLQWRSNVKLYSDLYSEAYRDAGEKFKDDLSTAITDLRKRILEGDTDLTEASRMIIGLTLSHVKDTSPVIVIALVPPYYPFVANSMLGAKSGRVDALCDDMAKYAKIKFGDNLVKHCLVGMSDLSFFMSNAGVRDNDYVRENMLLWNDMYCIPFDEIGEISMPVLNIGPWGKGIHKYTERVFANDLRRRTPDLISFAVENMLG
jgi:arginine utilization protein RocB